MYILLLMQMKDELKSNDSAWSSTEQAAVRLFTGGIQRAFSNRNLVIRKKLIFWLLVCRFLIEYLTSSILFSFFFLLHNPCCLIQPRKRECLSLERRF